MAFGFYVDAPLFGYHTYSELNDGHTSLLLMICGFTTLLIIVKMCFIASNGVAGHSYDCCGFLRMGRR